MATPANGSPLPPTSHQQQPFFQHKNAPLAPSQELAYRSKCIELRRRLNDIERTNDEIRKRIQRERKAQDKMRLNRAILLNHLKEMMQNGKRLTPEQLKALSGNITAIPEELAYNDTNANHGSIPPSTQTTQLPADDDAPTDGTEEEEIAQVSAPPPSLPRRAPTSSRPRPPPKRKEKEKPKEST